MAAIDTPAAESAGSDASSTATFERGRSIVTIDAGDGSTTTFDVAPNGDVFRATRHVDPSTGAEVLIVHAADGTVTTETQLPGGDRTVVIQHTDRTTERIETTIHSDGTSSDVHVLPDGSVETTNRTMDPDGTAREVHQFADGRSEVRTFRILEEADGSTVTQTRVRFADGRVESTDAVVKPDGTRVTTHVLPDGGTEVTNVRTDQFGEEFTVVSHPDGSETHSSVMHLTHPDGSVATVTRGPEGLTHRVEQPDGTITSKHIFPDKTFEESTETTRPDGTVVTKSRDRFGTVETIEQKVEDGRFTTDITRSDGTSARHVVGTDGSVQTRNDNLLGDRFETTINPDGSGTVRISQISNGTVITERTLPADPPRSQGVEMRDGETPVGAAVPDDATATPAGGEVDAGEDGTLIALADDDGGDAAGTGDAEPSPDDALVGAPGDASGDAPGDGAADADLVTGLFEQPPELEVDDFAEPVFVEAREGEIVPDPDARPLESDPIQPTPFEQPPELEVDDFAEPVFVEAREGEIVPDPDAQPLEPDAMFE